MVHYRQKSLAKKVEIWYTKSNCAHFGVYDTLILGGGFWHEAFECQMAAGWV